MPWGLFVEQSLDLSNSAYVDGWDSREGRYGEDGNAGLETVAATNTVAECGVSLSSSTLRGDLWIGPGGRADEVVCAEFGGQVTGEVDPLSDAFVPTWPGVPTDLGASTGDEVVQWGETVVYDRDRRVDSLQVTTGATLRFEGDVRLWVDGPLAVQSATVSLAKGARVQIWVSGEARVEWSSTLNQWGDPSALRLHVYSEDGLRLETGGQVTGRVAVDGPAWYGSAYLYGTLQARTLVGEFSGGLHVDAAQVCE